MLRIPSPVALPNPSQPGPKRKFADVLDGSSVLRKISLITTASVVLSWLVMLVYHTVAVNIGSTGTNTTIWVIGTVTPLVVAPFISWYFAHVMQELRVARDLAQTLAITDVLTGAFNRRHFMAQAEAEFAKAQRYQIALSVIMLDIDQFKSVNDQHGHSAGDDVLVSVSEVIAKCLREPDLLARYGGEEFIVLLPQTGGPEAMVVAERIRHEVAMLRVPTEGEESISVTVSLGVAARGESTGTLAMLLKNADGALYQCKTRGRNQSALAV